MLQSSIARLNGSLIALNRTSAWEIPRVFCLIEMSHLMEVPYLRKYHISWKCHVWKIVDFHKEIQQVTRKIQHRATCGHTCKNEVANEQYRTYVQVISNDTIIIIKLIRLYHAGTFWCQIYSFT